MASSVEAGWDSNGWHDVNLGVEQGMILFRKRRATASLFVNNRFGTIYGSNCLDCRYALRDWARPMANLFGKAAAAATCSG